MNTICMYVKLHKLIIHKYNFNYMKKNIEYTFT